MGSTNTRIKQAKESKSKSSIDSEYSMKNKQNFKIQNKVNPFINVQNEDNKDIIKSKRTIKVNSSTKMIFDKKLDSEKQNSIKDLRIPGKTEKSNPIIYRVKMCNPEDESQSKSLKMKAKKIYGKKFFVEDHIQKKNKINGLQSVDNRSIPSDRVQNMFKISKMDRKRSKYNKYKVSSPKIFKNDDSWIAEPQSNLKETSGEEKIQAIQPNYILGNPIFGDKHRIPNKKNEKNDKNEDVFFKQIFPQLMILQQEMNSLNDIMRKYKCNSNPYPSTNDKTVMTEFSDFENLSKVPNEEMSQTRNNYSVLDLLSINGNIDSLTDLSFNEEMVELTIKEKLTLKEKLRRSSSVRNPRASIDVPDKDRDNKFEIVRPDLIGVKRYFTENVKFIGSTAIIKGSNLKNNFVDLDLLEKVEREEKCVPIIPNKKLMNFNNQSKFYPFNNKLESISSFGISQISEAIHKASFSSKFSLFARENSNMLKNVIFDSIFFIYIQN